MRNSTNRCLKFNLAALLGLLVLSAAIVQGRAAEQPKPGPEHKKLEVQVGEWSYEGTGVANPFGPAGKFKGKSTSRMVLGGFFLQTEWKDTNDAGYIAQGIYFAGWDPIAKTYTSHGCENDGSANVSSLTIEANIWTSTGTRTDTKGKVYKTRDTTTISADGRSFTEIGEYSADDGKTWAPMYNLTGKLIKK